MTGSGRECVSGTVMSRRTSLSGQDLTGGV